MKLALQTVICCCVFTTVLPLVQGATEELNTSLKKRLRVLLHSRMRRDLPDGLVTLDDLCAEILKEKQQNEIENSVSPSPSSGIDSRSRRSASSRSAGCVLVTCSYHDLLFKLHQITNRQTDANAPEKKIGSHGYGRRRRRSLLDLVQLAPEKKGQRRGHRASHRAHRLESRRTVA